MLQEALSFANPTMRILDPIVQPFMLTMFNTGQYRARRIAPQLVGDDYPWDILIATQDLAEETGCCLLVAPFVHQDVQDGAFLVHRTIEIVGLAIDLDLW